MTIPQTVAAGAAALVGLTGLLPGTGSLGAGSVDAGSLIRATPPARVEYVDSLTLPDDLSFGGYPVGGLSGIDFDRASGEFVAISDNRGEAGPVRLYTLGLPLENGALTTARLDSQVSLLDTDGAPYSRRAADTESVRWLPHQAGYVYTSEGEAKIGRPGFVREAVKIGVAVDHPAEHPDEPDREGEEDHEDGDEKHVRSPHPDSRTPRTS